MTTSNFIDTPLQNIDLSLIKTDIQHQLLVDLSEIWHKFADDIKSSSIISKIESETLTREEYLNLLRDMRQQIIHGVNWIARFGSSLNPRTSPVIEHLRNSIVSHASDENGDYKMLEKDYINAGGNVDDIRNGDINIGTIALDAFIMHEASKADPVQLIGVIFIIEGLGKVSAGHWAKKIITSLNDDSIVSFLEYHHKHDQEHHGIVERIISSPLITESMAYEIKRVAKVCAFLYANQYKMIGNYV